MIAAPYTAGELVVLIGAIMAGVGGWIAAIFAGLAAMRPGRAETTVAAVHEEVKTINGLALGQLADAAETRRIERIEPAARTSAEDHHVAVVPPVATRPVDIRDQPLGG